MSLREGVNIFTAVATDGGGKQATVTLTIILDTTGPTALVEIVSITSAGEALVGDKFFTVVAAADDSAGVDSVIGVISGNTLAPIADVPPILVEMHGPDKIGSTTSTHVAISTVESGTPVGINQISLDIIDRAGNQSRVTGDVNVVSARSNRNFFLFPGVNFMGLALIPDDPSLATLMTQDVTSRVSAAFAADQGGTVTLGDVVESIFACSKAGAPLVHPTATGAATVLNNLEPFQGMTVNTRETVGAVDVFEKVNVAGFTALQAVPIRVDIQGVFFVQGELPPDKELRVGYNLVAPHILDDTLFDRVYRGALIPDELAVSALTFERRVDPVTAEIFEGFVSNSLGDLLKPELSYWTFILDNPSDTRVNSLDDPLGPTITP